MEIGWSELSSRGKASEARLQLGNVAYVKEATLCWDSSTGRKNRSG